ncbi:hypothetical protein LSUE1_G007624, partial [Lachnellula suecica]
RADRAPAKRAVSPDNTCGSNGTGGGADNYTCPSDLPCCSINGLCGSTNDYCLTTAGCQSGFGNCTAPAAGTISPDETCVLISSGIAGYVCSTADACCSGKHTATNGADSGWRGSDTDYCSVSAGCQSAYGICDASDNSTTTGGKATPGTSTNGQCGSNLGTCASNECCSLAGFCGVTEDYCNSPDCQVNYGPACDANKIPSGTNTSSTPRDELGSVLYGSARVYDCSQTRDMALTFDDGPFIYTSHIKYYLELRFLGTKTNNISDKGAIDNASLAWPALIK